jgi:hypothetical protein
MTDDWPRRAPLAMDADTFRDLGHRLVDRLAAALEAIPGGPVTRNEAPADIRRAGSLTAPLPEAGADAGPCWTRRQRSCSSTRSSTHIPGFSGTSPRRPRR